MVRESESPTVDVRSLSSTSSSQSSAPTAVAVEAAPDVLNSPLLGSLRMYVVMLLMCCLFCLTSLRMNLGMAIVCMVNSTAFIEQPGLTPVVIVNQSGFISENSTRNEIRRMSQLLDESYELPAIQSSLRDRCSDNAVDEYDYSKDYHGTLLWSPTMQSQLFSGVAYGSLATVWISGYLADRFGPKFLMALTLIDSVIVGFLSPWLAVNSYTAFFIARFTMGLGEGFVYPSMSAAAARWFPPAERSRMAAFFTLGNQMASVFGFLVSSRMCSLSFLGGWPLIFYSFSALGLVVLLCWMIFMSDGPHGNPWISDTERRYIVTCTSSQFLPSNASQAQISANAEAGEKLKKPPRLTNQPIPWREMATSKVLMAIVIAQSGFNLSVVILQSYLPTYLKEVMRVDINTNGVLSILPFLSQMIAKMFYGVLSDWLKRRGILTPTQAVKLFQSIGSFGTSSVFLALALFGNCRHFAIVVILLSVYGTVFSAGICGFYTSMLSIAPAYSGLVTSITMSFGLAANALGPSLVALIHKTGDEAEWSMIFTILSSYNVFAGVLFFMFGSAEIQEWGRPKSAAPSSSRIRPLDAAELASADVKTQS